MKKLFFAIAALLICGSIAAQNSSDVRIYLNAGHGSWGPNDRPMPTIPYPNLASTGRPDTCGFYESNTNLWKILKLGETLEKMGVKRKNIMYSRRKNGPYPYVKGAANEAKYNRSLSEISAEVEANNMDMFISIHSNAASEASTANYPLILYRGNDGDGGDLAKGSRAMSQAIWGPHYMDELDPQSAYSRTNMNIRGDLDFYHGDYPVTNRYSGVTYHGYLGVLKHGVPGFLLEGFYHTYQPARHRALNKDYCGEEGVRVARGVCNYFGLTPETTGYVMGTVKDLKNKIVNDLFHYASGSIDQWMPVNGATVRLMQNGQEVASYQVDTLYNGIFYFEGIAPGSYTLQVEAEGYEPLSGTYTRPIQVKANATTYVNLRVEKTPPVIHYDNYPTPDQPAYVGLPGEFQMLRTTKTYTSLSGTIKRVLFRGDSAVVLTESSQKPRLYLINLKSSVISRTISTTGIAALDTANDGEIVALNDIAFSADGKLIGINKVVNQYSDAQVDSGYKRGTLRLYKWDSYASSPVLWASTQSSANFYRATMGDALTVSGESKDCRVTTTATTMSASGGMRMLCLHITGDTIESTTFTEKTINNGNFSTSRLGGNLSLVVSPRADSLLVIDGNASLPIEFEPAATNNVDSRIVSTFTEQADDSVGTVATGATFFKYGGRNVMVTPYITSGKVQGIKLYDITAGLDHAVMTEINGEAVSYGTAIPFLATGSKVSGRDLTLYLVEGRRFIRYTTVGKTQPTQAGITAYALKAAQSSDGENYTFSFTANSQPREARILLYDATTGEKCDSISVDSPVKGENNVTVPVSSLPLQDGGRLKWAVWLRALPVTDIVRLNSSESNTYTSAFSAIDDDTNSPYFGNIYLYDYVQSDKSASGLYVYSPSYTRANSTPLGAGIMQTGYRIATGEGGRVYIPDYSDSHPGVYVMQMPESSAFRPFFSGTASSAGLITNGSAQVGSSSPAVAVKDGKLYAVLEDMGNNIGVYDIGTGDAVKGTWSQAPTKILSVGSLLLNGNCALYPDPVHDGVWVSQIRYAGNNTAAVPSLIYVDGNGNTLFNSGSDAFAPHLNGSSGAGFAVSRDDSTLVINDASGRLQFFRISWDGSTPTLTPLWTYTTDVVNTSARNSIYQMSFDRGGNLICTGSALGVYTVPRAVNVTLIPAPESNEIVNAIHEVKAGKSAALSYNAATLTVSRPAGVTGAITAFDTTGAQVALSHGSTLSLQGLLKGVYIVKCGALRPIKVRIK